MSPLEIGMAIATRSTLFSVEGDPVTPVRINAEGYVVVEGSMGELLTFDSRDLYLSPSEDD